MLEKLHIPGVFWLALIAFFVEWLPQLFPGAAWLPIALLVLMAVAKAVEVLVVPPTAATSRAPLDRRRSALVRFLF
jgi:hypothetical protein